MTSLLRQAAAIVRWVVRLELWLGVAWLLLSASLADAQVVAGAETDQPASRNASPDLSLERRQSLPTPAQPSLFTLNVAARGGVQWVVDPPRARDDVFGFGALDLVLTARPTPTAIVLVDVESVGGPGPDAGLHSLTGVNQESDRLDGKDGRVFLREAWLRLQSADAGVRFNVGKLDVQHYIDRNFFAEDETRQFLNSGLLSNPLLASPPTGLGSALRVSQGDWRLALQVQQLDDITGDNSGVPYLVGELGRRNIFPLAGHYRWWARGSSVPERRQDLTWGSGVSIDQLVTDTTGLFLRAGLARSEGDRVLSHSASAGVQHTPAWLGRDKDLAGIGYGFLREPDGREHVVETYYNVSLAGCCSIIANVEWLLSRPAGRREHERVLPGLRAIILY
jgi:hypothetical protein